MLELIYNMDHTIMSIVGFITILGTFGGGISIFFFKNKGIPKSVTIIFAFLCFSIFCLDSYSKSLIKVPSVVGKFYENARMILDDGGLQYELMKNSNEKQVISQNPEAGTIVNKNSIVYLVFEDETEPIIPKEEEKEAPSEKESSTESVDETSNVTPSQADLQTAEHETETPKITESALEDISGKTTVSGTIAREEQVNEYQFVPDISGIYRFDITELYDNAEIYLDVFNELNEKIANGYISNGNGLTIKEMNAGERYKINIGQCNKTSDYILNIGYQTQRESISGKTSVSGLISYKDQANQYTFTPLINGLYRFDITELKDNSNVNLNVYNRLNEKIGNANIGNGSGLTVKDMVAGEDYRIEVVYYDGFSDYILKIGYQNPIQDISLQPFFREIFLSLIRKMNIRIFRVKIVIM